VVAEPEKIVAAGPDGYRQLYVALTRSTQALKVLYCGSLPDQLVPSEAPA
jgi:DNA helicase IV